MKILHTVLCLIVCTFSSAGQNSAETEEAHIKQLIVDTFNGVWSDLEPGNISKYHTPDFLLLEHGELWNNDTIANYMKQARLRKPLPKRDNSIEIIETKIFGDRAWVAYHNRATFTVEGKVIRKAYWLESATAVRTEEGWKLDMLHSTRVKNQTDN